MRGDRFGEPGVLIPHTMQGDHADGRVGLRPKTVPRVDKGMGTRGRDRDISRQKLNEIQFAENRLLTKGHCILSVPFAKGLGAGVEPPVFEVGAQQFPVGLAHAGLKESISERAPRKPRTIDAATGLAAPDIGCPLQAVYVGQIVGAERVGIDIVSGQEKGRCREHGNGQADEAQPRGTSPKQSRRSKPKSYEAEQEDQIHARSVNRIDKKKCKRASGDQR